jgi:hypothetical protein
MRKASWLLACCTGYALPGTITASTLKHLYRRRNISVLSFLHLLYYLKADLQ